jgi:predicted ester cyclase
MSTEHNKAMMRRFLEEGLRDGNLDLMDEIFAPDFVNHHAASGKTRDDLKRYLQALLDGVPDLEFTIEHLVAEGDIVVIHARGRGTLEREWLGIQPTGKRFDIETVTIARIAGGKVAERWYSVDGLDLMRQLGLLPSPAEAPA